jgi:hypothetical protein
MRLEAINRSCLLAAMLAIAILPLAAGPLSASRGNARSEPGLTYGMLTAIAEDIRNGPLGSAGVFFGGIEGVEDTASVLRTLGLTLDDLWWVPDTNADGAIDFHDATATMRALGGYADGITADRIVRAFVKLRFLEAMPAASVSVPGDPDPPTHIEFFSKKWTEGGHNSTVSATYPPNHLLVVTRDWEDKPINHSASLSKQSWPPNHYATISHGWLPDHHVVAASLNVPPGHSWTTSKSWPMSDHTQATSRAWPPEHKKDFSTTWPAGHKYSVSQAQNPDPAESHTAYMSSTWGHNIPLSLVRWPPGHQGNISNGWWPDDHETTKSRKYWPPSHSQLISKTWDDPENDNWPSNHHKEISRTWTPAQPAEPANPAQPANPAGS